MLSFEEGLIEGEPVFKRMGKISRFCAESVGKHFGDELDFSPESLSRLDRVILRGWGEEGEEVTVDPKIVVSFGAYVGEVLVRRTAGRWVSGLTEDEPAKVMFLGRNDNPVDVSPFMLVREKFENMYGFDLGVAYTALEQRLKELGVS